MARGKPAWPGTLIEPPLPPELTEAQRTIYAKWDKAQQAWIIKVPYSDWTRLQGVWGARETEDALLTGLRLTHGGQALRGMRILKLEAE